MRPTFRSTRALLGAGAAVALVVGAGLVVAAPARAAAGCQVAYSVNQWSTGFTANVTVTNLGDPITGGWTLTWDYAGNQQLAQSWNSTFAQSGQHVTLTSVDWNKNLGTGATVNPGFNASFSGTNPAPASFKLNNVTCNGATTTTAAGTTTIPTTTRPSTTTAAPTTAAPTTAAPTTRTASPTTAGPTTSRPPTTSPSPTSGAKTFKGVGNAACADLGRLKMSWWYNWYVTPGSCTTGEFIPMVSGKDKHGAGDIAWSRDQAINGGYQTILGFNEPNKSDQANMSVATAVSLWPTLTSNASIRIGSPATSADGQAWFNDFMAQVTAKNLRVDFIALHWYGWNAGSCDANATQFENYLNWAESFPGNRPIWITEMGCMNLSNPDMATVTAFYRGVLAVLARHPRVERYAWYPWNTNNELVDANGALTSLGTTVANAPATR